MFFKHFFGNTTQRLRLTMINQFKYNSNIWFFSLFLCSILSYFDWFRKNKNNDHITKYTDWKCSYCFLWNFLYFCAFAHNIFHNSTIFIKLYTQWDIYNNLGERCMVLILRKKISIKVMVTDSCKTHYFNIHEWMNSQTSHILAAAINLLSTQKRFSFDGWKFWIFSFANSNLLVSCKIIRF